MVATPRPIALALVLACLGCDAEVSRRDVLPDLEVDPRQRELGRLLFYDPVMSADGETACATCHSELWGMSDGLPTSVGLGGGLLTGPGRKGPNVLTRNASTLWNVGYRELLFWDGRETSLEVQALTPMHSPVELGMSPEEVVLELRTIDEYVSYFADAFGDADESVTVEERAGESVTVEELGGESVTVERLATALAAFERSLVSRDSLYDGFLAGDSKALDAEQQRGLAVFEASGCDSCHIPPLFSSSIFAVRRDTVDPGRFAVSGLEADRGAMLTPTLRNVRDSAPYFHDGSVATLEEAVVSELERSGVKLSSADKDALVAFLGRGLADRSREPDRPEKVPSGLEVPVDGFRIPRP
jgi:cytochrome c peroxidase